MNLGSGSGITIRELVETMQKIVPFEYAFDPSKPSGKKEKLLNLEKAKKILGYEPKTALAEGLAKTWKWFLQNEEEHTQKINYFLEKNKT